MKIGSAIAIYLLFWAISLFVILPFGVRTHEEAGIERVPGQADSAPHAPMLWRKLLFTTLLSAVLFGLFYANLANGWIGLDDVVPTFLRPDVTLRPH